MIHASAARLGEVPGAFDVCIIGAGWSGLLACKYALEHRLSVVVLERREWMGGVWNFTEDPDVVTVMESTVTSTSATVTEAADFPMDPALGNFLHREQVQAYLERYAAHFDLVRHIRFEQHVENVAKSGDWLVRTRDSRYRSRYLVQCAGTNHERREDLPKVRGFAGQITHVGSIKSIAPGDYGAADRVLVYGGGESASDVVELLVETPARITWAIPNGQHFFRKAGFFYRPAPGRYRATDPALDEASSPCAQRICSIQSSKYAKPGMRWLCTLASTGTVMGYEGHGIPEWRKAVPFLHAMTNKNGHAVEHVKSGRVTARGEVAACSDSQVAFRDGRSDVFTHIILCTGYEHHDAHLPEPFASRRPHERYLHIFDPDDPSLLFLGYARPNVGSIPMLTEIQCLVALKVLSGERALPDARGMRAAIVRAEAERRRHFVRQRLSDSLVYPFLYGYELAELGGVRPDYARLLRESPMAFLKTYFSPLSAAHFLLNDPARRRRAVEQIWSHRSIVNGFVLPWVYLVSRLLLVDPVIHAFQALHFRLRRRTDTPFERTNPLDAPESQAMTAARRAVPAASDPP